MSDKTEAERAFAFDLPRLWATHVQSLLSDDQQSAILVFREQANVAMEDKPDDPPVLLTRNIASIVMPVAVVRSLRDVLLKQFPLEQKGGENGKPA